MPLKMHPHTTSQLAIFSLKALSAAVLATTLVSSSWGAGLGRLTIFSALGQPLNAEIELTSVTKDEAGSLVARLASADAFKQANVELNPALLNVRFSVEQRGGRQFIRVMSPQPINEPYIDMLLELGSSNGRLVREYTFLLDPVEVRNAQVAALAAASANTPKVAKEAESSAPVRAETDAKGEGGTVPQSAQPAVRSSKDKALSTPVTAATAPSATGDKTYLVKQGDSLARIANQMRPAGVSLDQMLVALYQANPSAFPDDNMNRMRAGKILSIPTAEVASGTAAPEAKAIVIAQALDFSNYRNKLAGQVASAEAAKVSDAKRAAGGSITSKVEEPKTAATDSKDKLKLSKVGELAVPPSRPEKGGLPEDGIAKDKAIAEANTRVKELERNVNDLQKLLEMKNKELADQQKKVDSAAKVQAPAVPAIAPSVTTNEPKKTEPPVAVAPPVVAAVVPPATPISSTTPTTPAPPPAASPGLTPDPVKVDPAAAELAAAKNNPAAKAPSAVAAPAPTEVGFIDSVINSSLLLPGLGVILVGLGALSIVSSRRKKKSLQFEDSILTDSNLKANSLFGSTGGQNVDTTNSVFNSNFAPSASQLNANEVDPVAEADVYIAYGRDAQAEEILKEALRTQPEHNAVRLKLLEIYAARKDRVAFELMASELYAITKGEGLEWDEAASMGIALDPNNPLYAGGKVPDGTVAVAGNQAAVAQSMEEPDLEGLLAMTPAAPETMPKTGVDDPAQRATDPLIDAPAEPLSLASSPVRESAGDDGLDFDLDGMGAQEVEPRDAAAGLTMPAPTMPHSEGAPLVETASTATMMSPFDFEISGIPPAPVGSKSPGGDIGAIAPLPDMHLPESTPAKVTDSLPEPELVQEAAASPADPLDFDLSGISLDLAGEPVAHDRRSDDLALSMDEADTLVLEDDAMSGAPEMATKLDLAIAYEEIGDKEGARELLDEVIKGGTGEQVSLARSMLAKLA